MAATLCLVRWIPRADLYGVLLPYGISLTDSVAAVAATKAALSERLQVVPCAPLIADAITRLHRSNGARSD
ncbi:hypothetical protein ACVDG3_22585 [Meridianimarinicoccus sp. RP-17]|uniref:hypothetical protein n=1 Tax=Meridianimarinicoccus zhengii TaxID=2056810 RepID=UPI0013A6D3CE|nr:hypothetical protein [Phycocomes zhengii]